MNTWLTPSFTLEEMYKSSTAIKNGWDNKPGPNYINNLRLLCVNVLQPVRNHFKLPVTVSSGYRSANLNRAMGGADNSQHLLGQAADIEIAGVPNADLWRYIYATLPFDQVIAEHIKKNNGSAGWIHVSYNKANTRGEALSCTGPNTYVAGLHYAVD